MIEESSSPVQSLFLLDELFKGTNTIERIAAGKAVLSYLSRGNHLVFVSTHDLELTDLLETGFDLYHFTELVEHGSIAFDYKLRPGNLTTRNAIRILELNAYPAEIIREARDLSEKMTRAAAKTG
jgi:DNA mismatch repair ATPase MutS